jgi:hypothetical protein
MKSGIIFAHIQMPSFSIFPKISMSLSATIKRYLKEERLEIVDDKNTFLLCEKCNTPIKSGMYCDECAKIVQKEKSAMRPSFK